jgi:hypothetical protein
MPRAKRDGSRGVIAGIDRRIAELDQSLESVPEWMAERRSLLAARKELTGEPTPSRPPGVLRRITQDEVAAYLAEHPGSKAAPMAKDLGVALTTISQHLHRGRDKRFERRKDGWHLIPENPKGKGK